MSPTCSRCADVVADLGRDVLERSGDRLDRRVDDVLEVESLDGGPVERRSLALVEAEAEAQVVDKPLERLAAVADLAHDLGAPAVERAVVAVGIEQRRPLRPALREPTRGASRASRSRSSCCLVEGRTEGVGHVGQPARSAAVSSPVSSSAARGPSRRSAARARRRCGRGSASSGRSGARRPACRPSHSPGGGRERPSRHSERARARDRRSRRRTRPHRDQ